MTRLGQVLIGMAWFVATIGANFSAFGRTVNGGFVGAIVLGLGATCVNRRAFGVVPTRVVLPALALAVLAFLIPALAQGGGFRTILSVSRGCLAIAWFALLLGLSGDGLKQTLGVAGLALLTVNLALALASPFSGNFSAFEHVQHEYAAGLPRLRGLANTPAPAGVWALVCLGLGEASSRPRLRWLTRALGLLEASASLSVALLALPALFAALLPQRWLRWPLVGAAALFAAMVLYFQPIELNVAGRSLPVSRELPEYWSAGLGPEYMPRVTLGVPGFAVTGHVTAYGKLARRGISCFAEHPLAGVGPGRFREVCRVMAMNTFGEWSDQRDSHNQVGGLLGELGIVGVALLSLACIAVRRGYRFDALSRWQRAVWVGLLVCGLGSEDLLTLPVLALLASQLVPRPPSR